jgi:hypothetical protein
MAASGRIVELLVIGFSGLAWILLLLLSVFGYDINIDLTDTVIGVLPALYLIYVVGIVTDRIADVIFEKIWTENFEKDLFKSPSDYQGASAKMMLSSDRLADIIESIRSRIRICRGCAFNSLMTIICFNVFIWARIMGTGGALKIALFGNVFLTLLCVGLWFSWKRLILAHYAQIRDQSKHLK